MKKIVTYGSFDLFHNGHLSLLKRARELGDYLIVGVTTEQYDKYRGKINVVDPLLTRVDNVRKTGLADEVIIEDHEGQKISDIQKYGVDIFTVGDDWVGKFDYLKEYCEVIYLPRTKDISSTELRSDLHGIIRLGVVGSGRIASRFTNEVNFVDGIRVDGVYNPRIESARSFAEQFSLNFYKDDYSEFLKQIDAVYIATPHETHYGYARQAILAGKHVLCEKPMTLSASEARQLFLLAGDRGVVLMEAVKTAYAAGFLELLAIAKTGRIGTIHDVEATFTKLPPSIGKREMKPGVGGSFTELASYPLLPILKLLGQDWEELSFESIRDQNGVDIYTKAHFRYKNAMATAKTGLGVKSEGQLIISGTKGYILVPSPWWLTKSFEVCFEDTSENERFSAKWEGFGLRYELADFVRQMRGTAVHNFQLSAGDSIALAGIMEKFLAGKP